MKTFSSLRYVTMLLFLCTGNLLTAQTNTFKKTFGGSNSDYGHSLALTSDGGFIITGLTLSFGDTLGDVYIIKTDGEGTEQWTKIINGSNEEGGNSIVQTTDGGYFIVCHTESYGAGDCDAWAIKTDHSGNVQWDRTSGGLNDDVGFHGIQTSDGNYVMTGVNRTNDWMGSAFLVKYNANGDTLWTKNFTQFQGEIGMRIAEAADGDYVIACRISTTLTSSPDDILILKTDADGNLLWSKNIGGAGSEGAYGFISTTDGGFIVAGSSTSFGAGDQDAYLVKINSSGVQQWSRNYGGLNDDEASFVAATGDGGYIISGSTKSFGDSLDIFLIKTDAYGNQQWMKTIGDANYMESANWIVACADGGYAMTGYKQQTGTTDADLFFVKTDKNGNASTNIIEQGKKSYSFMISPNPAMNTIHVSYDNNFVKPVIEIFNSVGSLITRTENQKDINISGLSSGIYNVNLFEGNRLLSQKFVKQ